jgi:hypothetical protein
MRTNFKLRPAILLSSVFAIVLLALVAACGDDDDNNNSQQGSESAVCGDINAFDSAVDDVKDLNSSSSIDDITKSLTNLRTSASNLRTSLQDIKYDKTDEIQAMTSDLQQALTSAFSSGSVSQAQVQINDAIKDVQNDLSDARDKANCD